jgi:superoxide dismutase, Fe-Mn family
LPPTRGARHREHAYYVDYRNERERYLSGVIGERLNWEFAERNLAG